MEKSKELKSGTRVRTVKNWYAYDYISEEGSEHYDEIIRFMTDWDGVILERDLETEISVNDMCAKDPDFGISGLKCYFIRFNDNGITRQTSLFEGEFEVIT
jgi:hypothetical protein